MADWIGQAAEDPDQNQQPLHDHVAKHHVEQQLFIGPARPARWLAPCIVTLRLCEQPMELDAGALQVGGDTALSSAVTWAHVGKGGDQLLDDR